MSNTTVSGIVHLIEPTKEYGSKGFRKRLVVLEQPGKYSNFIPVEFIQDSCDSADKLTVGDEVEVTYRLNGRKWQRDEQSEVRYFVSVEVMSFRIVSTAAPKVEDHLFEPPEEPPPQPSGESYTEKVRREFGGKPPEDDIPF
jgi:hypothetical protein